MRRLCLIDSSRDLILRRLLIPTSTLSAATCPRCHGQRAPSQTAHAPFSSSTVRRGDSIPFTEKVRRRIWGTDQPPGLADPYSQPEPLDALPPAESEVELAPARPAVLVDDVGYEPAKNWMGLESVGGEEEVDPRSLDPTKHFKGFIPFPPLSSAEDLTAALRRAIIEVYFLRDAGLPISHAHGVPETQDLTTSVHASVSSTGEGATLQYPSSEVRQHILDSASRRRQTEDSAPLEAGVEQAHLAPSTPDVVADPTAEQSGAETPTSDSEWLRIPLTDLAIRFAVIKRVLQLTGVRVRDPSIGQISDAQSLLRMLVTPPRPTKLAEALMANEELVALPNLAVFDRRVTPIDREKQVGRWKVIEAELRWRGLPVTGRS